MATPGKPRQSGIPGPGRASSIPTPGRSRSSSNVHQTNPPGHIGQDDISRAFADAIKANDPSQHRIVPPNISSTSSLSPQALSHSLSSGRRSVAGRPSSSASTSSTKVQERTKTPVTTRISSRPPSRQSEIMSMPKAPKFFDIGDNVRIESLGFEGTLRYIGEIDGKSGLWAGVELSGGFSGKGKNDGTVGGKQYFSCPDKCGVFVATTKLSAPTVGPGAIARPSSVASSRGGRTTPANPGRSTPSMYSTTRTPSASYSNGRVTPSGGSRLSASTNGRVTPTSSIGTIRARPFKTPTQPKPVPITTSLSETITAGSRAAKYMTMTAMQLSSRDRDTGADSPTRRTDSPSISRALSSPSRISGSPFSTPKALNGRTSSIPSSPSLPSIRNRPSMNTPRARIPSNVAMPPPPSPKPLQSISPAFSVDSNRGSNMDKFNGNGLPFSLSRPGSSASSRSAGTDEQALIEQLQSRLDAVEYENERLRSASEVEIETSSSAQLELEQLRSERQEVLQECSLLGTKLSELETLMNSQTARIETLELENQELIAQLTQARAEAEEAVAVRQADVETHSVELKALQERVDKLDLVNAEKDGANEVNLAKIKELEYNFEKTYNDMEEERKELGVQIDELRIAGQETIALYEERLSTANDQRYELEYRISTLEASLSAATNPDGAKESTTLVASAATQIDNETLRDQVQHLQKKSTKLEEQLEDTRATMERDVASYQDKIERIRQDDDQTKRDLAFKTREVEQLLKSETGARNRIEEIEEALRESTVALETARGEVELLRAEIANLDVLIDDATEDDISSKLVNFTKRAAADKARYHQEINKMEQIITNMRAENEALLTQGSMHQNGSAEPLAKLRENFDAVETENDELREQVVHLQERLSEMVRTLDARTSELESARKKSNRDATAPGMESTKPTPSKFESLIVREEVAGLKHIVQDLQKENLALAQQIKLKESENQLLLTETEQLRQEVHILEDNLDTSFREGNANATNDTIPSPVKSLNNIPQAEQNGRVESDVDQMRKRLNEMEMKHARTLHDLNKEISELEALVESKIYREDELEQEVEKLKEKLSRHKKSSKNGSDSTSDSSRHRLSSASTLSIARSDSREEEVCEICERPGHDIFNCSLLKEDVGQVICGDCESPGHIAADCPHSQEVF